VRKIAIVSLLLLSLASYASAACFMYLLDESVPPFSLGVAGSFTFSVCCGTPPYTFSIHSGHLPPGLTLSSSGVISGTPTTAGYWTVCIRLRDAAGCTYVQCFEITVE
jgi:hypothetical protein